MRALQNPKYDPRNFQAERQLCFSPHAAPWPRAKYPRRSVKAETANRISRQNNIAQPVAPRCPRHLGSIPAGISPLRCNAPARYPSRTNNHSLAGKRPRARHTWRPGRSRNSRYRTSALPPYCAMIRSVLRGQFRGGSCVSGGSVVTGASAHYAALRFTLQGPRIRMTFRFASPACILKSGQDLDLANFSSQLVRPVTCIITNNVTMEPIVIARPVNPLKKNAYENSTR